ncbi:Phosphatidylinositol 5-phosphate 4-kinase type-2 alpha [Aphelenchoides besseyi]|nr:Phosphatidylinositol 5-phosphate 4-kinase type-2 alpha [Aphelenchoides besseyi]
MASRRQAGSIGQIRKKPLVPKWKVFRAKDPMMSVFMWGVNHTVTELMHVPPPGLLFPDEFRAFSKVKVDNHFFNKENMPSHFKVKHYCPNVFRSLRQQFGVDQRQYLSSLSAFEPEPDPQESAGLYVSYDRMFVIKTIDSESVAELHSILFQYHSHVVERQGKTLLPQYLGLYRITVDGTDSYHLVMRNVFGSKYTIHKKYDLKGSTVQRQASEKERSKELPTYKDNDFLEDKYKLFIPPEVKTQLMDILKSDTEFLAKLHLMDYSLLVGIHDVDVGLEEAVKMDREADEAEVESGDDLGPSPPDSPIPSVATFNLDDEFFAISSSDESPKKYIYFVGLVDILTYYGVKKRTASAAKSVKYGAEAENISTVKPDQYARRLLEFVNRNVVSSA